MRLLFTFAGGWGHLEPLLPVALAARQAGHEILVSGHPGLSEEIRELGLPATPTGPPRAAAAERRRPLRPLDDEREDAALRDHFADRLARARVPDVLALCERWRPDVVVCDELDFGAMVAAERAELPRATVLVSAAGTFVRPHVVGARLSALRKDHGLPADPGLAMLHGDLVLSAIPPSFRDPVAALRPEDVCVFRPCPPGDEHAVPPRWWPSADGRPVVYVTLGTEFGVESGDLLQRVVHGLCMIDVAAVVTVGREQDPAELGAVPAAVHVARWLPQDTVLPLCHLVVSHGGSGTVVGALAHGLGSLILPMGADQQHNADRCVALGVGRALDAVRATPADVAAAVNDLLGDARARAAAGRICSTYRTLPGPEAAVTRIEGLVAGQP